MFYYVNPLTWLKWISQFLFVWFVGIRWKGLTAAVPAILVLLLMVVGTTLAWSSSNRWRDVLVANQMKDAAAQEEYEVVDLLLQRQLRDSPDDAMLKMQQAQNYDAMGRGEEARTVFRDLTFEEQNGKAAYWLMKNDFDIEQTKDWSKEQVDDFAALAEIALLDRPNDLQLHGIRANYLMRERKFAEAVVHLEMLRKSNPAVGLQIAMILKQQGDVERARNTASAAARDIGERVADEPKRPELRMLHAQALIFLEQYEEAIRTLSAGFERSKDERLRTAIGEAIILYSGSLSDRGNDVESLVTRLRLLQQAVRLAPSNPAVLKAIADTILSTVNEDNEQVVALRESILSGTSPGIGHFVSGTAAMMKGDSELAAIELRLAAKTLPESAAILNNFAVAKTANAKKLDNDQVELAEALEMANKAIELTEGSKASANQVPFFRETRGQILLALGRYEESISDFDSALIVPALKEQANLALAEAWEGLGQTDKAKEYLVAAENLKAKKERELAEKRDALEQFGETLRTGNAGSSDNAKPADESKGQE